jgi:hypothetical protein
MPGALRAPPWTNLWRLLVTTLLFSWVALFAVGLVTDLEAAANWPTIAILVSVAAYFVAAVVVWSDIPWPGDPA